MNFRSAGDRLLDFALPVDLLAVVVVVPALGDVGLVDGAVAAGR
jgi:hypothetical protein